MSLGHEHGFVLIGLAGPMDVVHLSPSLSLKGLLVSKSCYSFFENLICLQMPLESLTFWRLPVINLGQGQHPRFCVKVPGTAGFRAVRYASLVQICIGYWNRTQ